MNAHYAKSTAVALALLASCGSETTREPVVVDPGPFCLLGTLPFEVSNYDWQDEQNESQAELSPRIKHQPSDILSNGESYAYTDSPGTAPMATGNYVVRGVMARTKATQGLAAFAVPGETTSLWGQDEGEWNERGETQTTSADAEVPGQYQFDLGTASLDGESRWEYAVLNAESSCAAHAIYELPRGRKIVLADIDETITLSDEEIFLQIADEAYDQEMRPFSVELTQAWDRKGYQLVYLTARPHFFRAETRAWLAHHGYADGPIITAPELVLGDTARQYKFEWARRLLTDLEWDIVAAYGNSESDISGYGEAGIPKAVTFIIGESAGLEGTVAIENNSYEAHIQDYVEAQPDATLP